MLNQDGAMPAPLWIDFDGAILDHEADDFDPSIGILIEGPGPDDPTPEEAELDELGDFLSRQYTLIDAEVAALKTQFERRVRSLKARRNHLAYMYEWHFRKLLKREMDGGRKKSKDFSHGRAGFRSSKKIEITDEKAALGWAAMNCNEAIKKSVTLIKSALPADMIDDGIVPGVERVEKSNFYLQPAKENKQ